MNFILNYYYTVTSITWSDIATFIFSLTTAYLAYQQLKIVKMQRKDNLYDRRYLVYEKLREFAQSIIDERCDPILHRKLLRESMLQEFLFKDDIKNFMKEIWNKYNNEIGVHFLTNDIVVKNKEIINYRTEEVRKSYIDAVNYFMDKFHFELRDKFEPYLKLEENWFWEK